MIRLTLGRSLTGRLAVAVFALAPLAFTLSTLTGCSDDRGGQTAPEEVEEGGQSEPPA